MSKVTVLVLLGFVGLGAAWWHIASMGDSSRSRGAGAASVAPTIAAQSSDRRSPRIEYEQKSGAQAAASAQTVRAPRPGSHVADAFGKTYSTAREEHLAIVHAVRASGTHSASWTEEASERVQVWARSWTSAKLRSVECFVDGCVANAWASDMESARSVFPVGPPDGWQGPILRLAPFEDEFGTVLVTAVLLNPEIDAI